MIDLVVKVSTCLGFLASLYLAGMILTPLY